MSTQTKILYRNVADQIKDRIFSSLSEGKAFEIPSERLLAQEMGVSGITVRQAIKSLVNQGIVTTRHRSGAYVSQEVMDGQKTVAVISGHHSLDNTKSPWHLLVYREICRALEQSGWNIRSYTVFHGTLDLDQRAMNTLIEDAQSRKFAGVISCVEFRFLRPGFQQLLDGLQIRYVNYDVDSSTNAIIPDFHALGQIGVEYFHRLGLRRVGLIGNSLGPAGYFGFIQAVHACPEMETRETWIRNPEPSIEAGIQAFNEIWSASEKPQGLVISDEISFLGVVMAMLNKNVRYPNDLHLVVQGTEGTLQKCMFAPPRIVYSPAYCANLTVQQLMILIRGKTASVPSVRFAPILQLTTPDRVVAEEGKPDASVVCAVKAMESLSPK